MKIPLVARRSQEGLKAIRFGSEKRESRIQALINRGVGAILMSNNVVEDVVRNACR